MSYVIGIMIFNRQNILLDDAVIFGPVGRLAVATHATRLSRKRAACPTFSEIVTLNKGLFH